MVVGATVNVGATNTGVVVVVEFDDALPPLLHAEAISARGIALNTNIVVFFFVFVFGTATPSSGSGSSRHCVGRIITTLRSGVVGN